MAALSGAAVLDVFDAGTRQDPLDRAITILLAAEPELSRAQLASMPLDERDARLFRAREELLGPILEWTAACPACGATVESTFDLSRLPPSESAPRRSLHQLTVGRWSLDIRVLDSRDIAAAAVASSPTEARAILAQRSVVRASRGGVDATGTPLPATVVAAISRRLAEAAPLAEVLIGVSCPDCATRWEVSLDIAAFMWEELSSRAQTLLGEVAMLARAFGWTESESLALSAPRRARYLELANS